uniref:NADH:flavin oxidoreductase/NADH oxidase N-terminal domain-containing protein n=1 Tax=Ascaris lumbricoides TaxID=6252 RepID=A0A9J2Q5D9_ASCLU
LHKQKSAFTDERYKSDYVPVELLQSRIDFPIATNLSAKNKIMKAPMTEMLATFSWNDPSKNGIPNDELLTLYKRWNDGGTAIIVTGCIAVTHKDLEGIGNAIIAKEVETDERREQFEKLAATVTDGTLIIAQIIHPGRRAVTISDDYKSPDMNFVSIAYLKDLVQRHIYAAEFLKTCDMNFVSMAYLKDLVQRHIYAAEFLKTCGFHGVEINVALDFALGQLVDASTNSRSDEYGGSLMNRTRILFEIIKGIRKHINDDKNFIVGMKMSSTNYVSAYDEEEFAHYCKQLDRVGLDYVTLTGGEYGSIKMIESAQRESTKQRQAFFAKFITAVRMNLKNVRAFICGGLRSAEQMWEAIYEGWCDGVAMAKPLAAEPDLSRRILNEEVRSAKKTLIEQFDYYTAKDAAGTQMWQIANKKPIFDLMNEHHVDAFRKALKEHEAKAKTLGAPLENFGYPKFEII